MTTRTFNYYADPGHAWVKVPIKYLKAIGIWAKVSGCSYIRNTSAYLEEDCDVSLLVNTLKANGVECKFRGAHSDKSSKIRGYQSYNVESIDWTTCTVK